MQILSFLAPAVLLVFGFMVSVAAGAARDAQDLTPTPPLTAFLIAAMVLVAQAILWVRFGASL